MKQILILFSALFFVCFINPIAFYAEGRPELSPECIEKGKVRNNQFNKEIMEDVKSSFNLNIDENSFVELSTRDLAAAHIIYGGRIYDTYYNSLINLFDNLSSRGEPKLFVRPLNAYFLYKEIDNKNVMVWLRLENKKWVIVETKKTMGKPIEFRQLKCEKEYLKKRNEYENKK
jgi:hypothetical protein